MVQHLGHVLRLPQVVRDAPVPGAVGALRASAGGVAVGVVIRVHPVGLVSPPHWLLLQKAKLGLTKSYTVTSVTKNPILFAITKRMISATVTVTEVF